MWPDMIAGAGLIVTLVCLLQNKGRFLLDWAVALVALSLTIGLLQAAC